MKIRFITLAAAWCAVLAFAAGMPGSASGQTITITTIDQLQKIGDNATYPLDGTYVLGNDIDASATRWWNSGAGFVPLASAGTPFAGSLDGQGHAIYNLYINLPATDNVGLFDTIQNAEIANLRLDNATVIGHDNASILAGTVASLSNITACSATGWLVGRNTVGGIAGMLSSSNIISCYCTAAVSGANFVGSIAGSNAMGSIINCSSSGTVTASGSAAGGIAGVVQQGSIQSSYSSAAVSSNDAAGGIAGDMSTGSMVTCCNTGTIASAGATAGGLAGTVTSSNIIGCYSTGAVTAAGDNAGGAAGLMGSSFLSGCFSSGAVAGSGNVGGLVGYNSSSSITLSYSTGAVTGSGDNVGGLAGQNNGSLINCYSTGAATGANDVGGLVGLLQGGGITYCYSTGLVTGLTKLGGLVGDATASTVSGCFWDNQTSGQAASAGGTGRATAALQTSATFEDAGWDFTATWGIFEGQTYPFFQTNSQPVAVPDNYTTPRGQTLLAESPGVLANDLFYDTGTPAAALVSGTAHGTLTLSDNGSFTYEPDAGFTGQDSFVYTANANDRASQPAAVTIWVNDYAVTAAPDTYTARRNRLLEVAAPGVLGNDSDAAGLSLQAVLVAGPAHGTLVLSDNGSFSYRPDRRYRGTDTFTYKATDGTEESATATVTITVGRKCLAAKLYGEESGQARLLRAYRDRVLMQSPAGRFAVEAYYELSEVADGLLDNSPGLSSRARQGIGLLLPWLQRSLETRE